MYRIHVLTTQMSAKSRAFNFPLQLHRRRLRDSGLDVRVFTAIEGDLFDCDVAFINEAYLERPWAGLSEQVLSILERGRKRAGRLVWFDTSDSTGTTQFEVLPYVDLYCKSQLLVDRSAYLREYRGGRLFTDYYAQLYGIEDQGNQEDQEDQTVSVLPSRQDLAKLSVGWNCSLRDHGRTAGRVRRVGRYFPMIRRYTERFVKPGRFRHLDMACRMGLGHTRKAVRLHREHIRTVLERKFGVMTDSIPRPAYLRELADARVGVSPFGYGEICLRDFEVMIEGAALVKPDMSHLETWPPLYLNRETYAAHRWDLSDLEETIETLLAGNHWRDLAENSQAVYRRYLSGKESSDLYSARVHDIVRAAYERTFATADAS